MVNWEAWGPTIVTVVMWVFMAGMLYNTVKDHGNKIAKLDTEVDSIKVRVGLGEVELAKLQSWRDGYNAATNRRDGYDAGSNRHNTGQTS
jgi:hypothetical protein